jgi:hypothetical protein
MLAKLCSMESTDYLVRQPAFSLIWTALTLRRPYRDWFLLPPQDMVCPLRRHCACKQDGQHPTIEKLIWTSVVEAWLPPQVATLPGMSLHSRENQERGLALQAGDADKSFVLSR